MAVARSDLCNRSSDLENATCTVGAVYCWRRLLVGDQPCWFSIYNESVLGVTVALHDNSCTSAFPRVSGD